MEDKPIDNRFGIALRLLIRCLTHLDEQTSEHHDGERLRRDILYFLAGNGYPGYAEVRSIE